jgi:hypothetical protein
MVLQDVKDTLRDDTDTDMQNSVAIYAKFLPALLLGVSVATRVENTGGWRRNDSNSEGKQNRSEEGHSCMVSFV